MNAIQLNSNLGCRVFSRNNQSFIIQETNCPFITKARIQKVALIALGFLAMAAVIASLVLFTPLPLPLIIAPFGVYCLVFPIFAGVFAWKIKDYDNPIEVALMRDKAISLDYKDLIKEHRTPQRILEARILFPQEILLKLEEAEQAERAVLQECEERIGSPMFRNLPKARESIRQLEKLQKDRVIILDWEASLKLHLERLEKRWV